MWTPPQLGCGAGNTVFPLLELNPRLAVFACDFAPAAVALVRAHPAYGSSGRVHAFVADITAQDLQQAAAAAAAPVAPGAAPPPAGSAAAAAASPAEEAQAQGSGGAEGSAAAGGGGGGCSAGVGLGLGLLSGGCDLASMVFVLSAIHPDRMMAVGGWGWWGRWSTVASVWPGGGGRGGEEGPADHALKAQESVVMGCDGACAAWCAVRVGVWCGGVVWSSGAAALLSNPPLPLAAGMHAGRCA